MNMNNIITLDNLIIELKAESTPFVKYCQVSDDAIHEKVWHVIYPLKDYGYSLAELIFDFSETLNTWVCSCLNSVDRVSTMNEYIKKSIDMYLNPNNHIVTIETYNTKENVLS